MSNSCDKIVINMKQLIINADDFGIHHDANQAIVELYKIGALSSATIMVTLGASSLEAMELAKKHNISVGLHFNLTLKDDNFKNRQDFEHKYILGKLSKKNILAELEKQYKVLIEHDIVPTHLDSHQHIHNWPAIFRIVAGFAKSKGIPVRIPEEWPIYNIYEKVTIKDLKQLIRKILFFVLSKFNKLQSLFLGVKTNKNLISIFALWPRPKKYEDKHLELVLARVKDKTEYMCHPIVSALGMQGLTSIADTSQQEFSLMTKESFLANIKRKNLELINYSNL